ncbi:MAG: hypothetical protein V7703_05210 [Hyphomicrobiales bacterium]
MHKNLKKNGLVAAGLMNIGGAVGCSRFFSNTAINEADPVVMSNFGLLMIVIWGFAYIGASTIRSNIMWLAAAFAIEKLVYVLAWLNWLLHNDLGPVYANDFLAGVFYSIYGLNDFVFMLFFLWLFVSEKTSHTR